jgi:transposase
MATRGRKRCKPLLSDEPGERIEPLLPPERPKLTGARPRVSDRDCLTGIKLYLKNGTPGEYLPQEMGAEQG